MRWIMLAVMLAVAGCMVQPRTVPMMTPFVESDVAGWRGDGPATITGQAFLRTNGGEVRTCAGQAVLLVPDSAYFREIVEHLARKELPTSDQTVGKGLSRKTICDAQGNFTFESVAAKPWIVITEVRWNVPTEFSLGKQGGILTTVVDAKAGVNKTILVEENFLRP